MAKKCCICNKTFSFMEQKITIANREFVCENCLIKAGLHKEIHTSHELKELLNITEKEIIELIEKNNPPFLDTSYKVDKETYCSHCNTRVSSKDKYCYHCGNCLIGKIGDIKQTEENYTKEKIVESDEVNLKELVDEKASTSEAVISDKINLTSEIINSFADYVDDLAECFDDLGIAIETYPNPRLPLHIVMKETAIEVKQFSKKINDAMCELEDAVNSICKYKNFTEEQYDEIIGWIEDFSHLKNSVSSNYSSLVNMTNSIDKMKIDSFACIKPKVDLVIKLKELCNTFKIMTGVYAELPKKIKKTMKCAIIIEDYSLKVEEDMEFDCTIDEMGGHEFEYYCAELLKKNGFKNVSVTPGSGDQGVDILAEKDSIKYAIQCKHYSSKLGNTSIQEVNAGKTFYGCHVGVVMTNSSFSKGAIALANATGVLLWDKETIKKMI